MVVLILGVDGGSAVIHNGLLCKFAVTLLNAKLM
jgi:hypothetical protein